MTEVRQCWAYNSKQQRCEHPAGHPGNHVIMSEWTDDECVMPVPVQLPPTLPPPPPPLVEEELKCVACSHKHRGGPCKCGCHEFIG